jgi:hypothetical protein
MDRNEESRLNLTRVLVQGDHADDWKRILPRESRTSGSGEGAGLGLHPGSFMAFTPHPGPCIDRAREGLSGTPRPSSASPAANRAGLGEGIRRRQDLPHSGPVTMSRWENPLVIPVREGPHRPAQ